MVLIEKNIDTFVQTSYTSKKIRKEVQLNKRKISFNIRLSDAEQELLKNASEKAGFANIAEYVRYMTIGDGKDIKGELQEIKEILEKLDNK